MAFENCLFPKYDNHGWLRHHQLYHRRANFVSCQWRLYEYFCWNHRHYAHKLARRSFWNGRISDISKVWLIIHTLVVQILTSASRYSWIPQVVVLLVLTGVAGKNFDTSAESTGESAAVTANRLTFFSLSLSAPVSWAAAGSDFYVYVSPLLKLSTISHTFRRDRSTIAECLIPFNYNP